VVGVERSHAAHRDLAVVGAAEDLEFEPRGDSSPQLFLALVVLGLEEAAEDEVPIGEQPARGWRQADMPADERLVGSAHCSGLERRLKSVHSARGPTELLYEC